jgi:hypothetical protein
MGQIATERSAAAVRALRAYRVGYMLADSLFAEEFTCFYWGRARGYHSLLFEGVGNPILETVPAVFGPSPMYRCLQTSRLGLAITME